MLDVARVLLVEDSRVHATICESYLGDIGYETTIASTGAEGLYYVRNQRFDVVLLDLGLPDQDGMAVLDTLKREQPMLPIIVITGQNDIATAVACMKAGAFDFLEKPAGPGQIQLSVKGAMRQKHQRRRNDDEATADPDALENLIAESPIMQEPLRWLKAAATSNANVMVTGESGTGKEEFAKALHELGERSERPFIAINCGAIPKDLLESELFGHKRGSFTGAISDRKGAVKEAEGGTLFLDEIGEMAVDLQVKLLRFIQTRTFKSVGSNREESVDIRIVSATNRNPVQAVAQQCLREDLFFRLNVISIELPPLRARGKDIVLIATKVMRELSELESRAFDRFTSAAEKCLMQQPWRGNVRELINVMQATRVICDKAVIDEHDLVIPSKTSFVTPEKTNLGVPSGLTLEQAERQLIENAIEDCAGNMSKAAEVLGVSPSTLYRKKKEWDAH